MTREEIAFSESWYMIEQLFEDYAKSVNLNTMSLRILEILYSHPEGCTQKKIVEESIYNKQSVNIIIKDFWQKGYVVLQELPEDRRVKNSVFTESGLSYASRIIDPMWQDVRNGLEAIEESKRADFLNSFAAYANYIKYHGKSQEKIRLSREQEKATTNLYGRGSDERRV